MSGNPDLGLKVLPALNGVALPLKKQVHSLGLLLDLCLLLDKQATSVARIAFFLALTGKTEVAFPWETRSGICGTCLGYIKMRLLQCTLLGGG